MRKKKKSNVADVDVVSIIDDDYDDRRFMVNAISRRTSAMSDKIDVPVICLDDDDDDDGLKTEKSYKLFLDQLRDDNNLGPLFDCHIRYEADSIKSESRQFQIFSCHSTPPKLEYENPKKSRVSQQRNKEAVGFKAGISMSVPLTIVRESIQRDNRAAERRKRKADELMAEALRKDVSLVRTKGDIQEDNKIAEQRKRRKAVNETLKAVHVETKAVNETLRNSERKAVSETSKAVPVELKAVNETSKAVNETSRNSESKVMNERSKAVPGEPKAVNGTSKAVPVELKAVYATSRTYESKAVNGTSKAIPVEPKAVNGTSKTVPVKLKALFETSKATPVMLKVVKRTSKAVYGTSRNSESKAVNETSKANPVKLKAVNETSKAIPVKLKAVNETSKAVPVELKALYETSRNSESKAINKTSKAIPVRLKAVNETSKAVRVELKSVNETVRNSERNEISRNSERKAVNETSGTAQITQMNKGVFAGRRKENQVESVGIVDKDYMNYLTWLVDSLKDFTTKPMENLQKHPSDLDPPITDTPKESTIVPEKDVVVEVKVEQDDEYLSDDSDIIVGDSPFLDGEVTPFVASKSMIIDLENESKKGEGSCLFKKELMDDLSRPYEEAEFLNLSREVSIHREVTRCRELRKGRETYYKSTELGQSYLERYEDFNEVYKLVDHGKDKVGALMLLRGFFFYLKNLTQEGAFKPWMD